MFNTGDNVVHPRHASGIVTKRRTIQYQGDERDYFCIDLVEGRGSVMIPVERLDEAGLREPIYDIRQIQQIMEMTPDTLVNDIHVRQSAIEGKIRSGDAGSLIQVLCDLCWRETVLHLAPTDQRLRESILVQIIQELKFNRRLAVTTIRQNLETMIQQAMQRQLIKV